MRLIRSNRSFPAFFSFPLTRTAVAALASQTAFAQTVPDASSLASGAPVKSLGVVTISSGQPTSLPTQIPPPMEGVTREQMEQTINATDSEDALKYLPSLLVRKRYIGDYNHAILSSRASGTGNSARSAVYASRSESFVSPKAALSCQWASDTVLKASTGRAVRFPIVGELYGATASVNSRYINDPNLQPEPHLHSSRKLTMKFLFAAKTIAASALCMLTLPAFPHIVLETKTALAGSTYKAVFQVGHGCQGAATTGVSVQIPAGFQGAKPYPKAGWTLTTQSAKLAQPYDRHGKPVTEDVSVVRWTASKEAALPDAHFDEFTLRGTLPEAGGPLWFKVLQTCESGSNDWSEIPAAGASPKGLKFPAVLLQVTGPETAAAAASAPAHAAGAHQH